MLSAPMLDPMGAFITELRADADVSSLVGTRVRAIEPMGAQPAPNEYAGDAHGAGDYQAFIVVTTTSDFPHPRVPVIWAEYAVRCYGTTPQNARAVWGAVVKAMHQQGPRVKSNGLGVYKSLIVGGGASDRDPDTRQPLVTGIIQFIATAQVVT